VIPLSVMAIIRTSSIVFNKSISVDYIMVVANHGFGTDIWSMPFENITYVLYVSQ
jgi:hypothetical protein